MDPDACLTELLQLVVQLDDDQGDGNELNPDDVERMCDLVQALDEWLCKGGFLPARWRPAAVPATAAAIQELMQAGRIAGRLACRNRSTDGDK